MNISQNMCLAHICPQIAKIISTHCTKMKFIDKDVFSKCEQTTYFLRLLKIFKRTWKLEVYSKINLVLFKTNILIVKQPVNWDTLKIN